MEQIQLWLKIERRHKKSVALSVTSIKILKNTSER